MRLINSIGSGGKCRRDRHCDNDLRAECAAYRHRHRIAQAAIDEPCVAAPDWTEDARHRDRGANRVADGAGPKPYLPARQEVGGDRSVSLSAGVDSFGHCEPVQKARDQIAADDPASGEPHIHQGNDLAPRRRLGPLP
jgi:hypothetical protein